MATVAAARAVKGGRVTVVKWAAVAAGDTITPYRPTHKFNGVTVYFIKGSAFGGNLSLTGTPDPELTAANFITQKDATDGSAIATKTADGVFEVLTGALAFAPVAGAGAAAVDVWLVFKNS